MIALWAIGGVLWLLLLIGLVDFMDSHDFNLMQLNPLTLAIGLIFWPVNVFIYIFMGAAWIVRRIVGNEHED